MPRRAVTTLILILGGLVLGLALPAAGGAAPKVSGEFPLQSSVGSDNGIVAGPDGNMWVTLETPKDIAQITPQGTVTEFNPTDLNAPKGIARLGPNLWVTQQNGVARVPAADPDSAKFFPVTGITDPRGITVGPDGNLWAASLDKVVRIDPVDPTGNSKAFAVLGGGRGIASSGGMLWAADFGKQRIVSVTTNGTAQNYKVGGGPQGVTNGPGNQIAYSNPAGDPETIGRITAGGKPQTTNTPMKDPFGLVFAADRAYWVAQFASENLGRLTPAGKYSTLGGISPGFGPRQIARGPGNTLWVTLENKDQGNPGKVARVSGVTAPSAKLDVKITKDPGKRVKTRKRRARVRFAFRSSKQNAKFECKLKRPGKKASYRDCDSPKRYRVKPGRYVFKVRAVSGGKSGTPARHRFRVIRIRG